MPEESPIDLEHHSKNIVQEVIRQEEIPETTQMKRRPIYERMLRRKHLIPLDPPTEKEMQDAILILRDDYLWVDDLSEEALRVLDEAGQ